MGKLRRIQFAAVPGSRSRISWAAFCCLGALAVGCYKYDIASPAVRGSAAAPPQEMKQLFEQRPDGVMELEMHSPGEEYGFDTAEKDERFSPDDEELRFRRAELRLRDKTPPGRVLADIEFVDGKGHRITAGPIDLLRLVPKIESHGEMQYVELLLEEFTRYGVSFRREHGEFDVQLAPTEQTETVEAVDRAYRLSITNNCLDPSKWEMALSTEDYSDFAERLKWDINLNQKRLLAHSWFYLDPQLYYSLVRHKNPHLKLDPALAADYNSLSQRAEQVEIDFDSLRTLADVDRSRTLEIGHQSGMTLRPLDREQYYKWDLGLLLDKERFSDYGKVLEGPVQLAQYSDRGFYMPDQPKTFDYAWLRSLDEVEINVIGHGETGSFIEVSLSGEGSPYAVRAGNIDLALLDEQRLYTMAFGVNPYPLSRRHNPAQSTITYDTDLRPEHYGQYLFMVDAEKGTWVNNQNLGFDRLYLGWDSIDRNVLEIYLLSYERIVSVWSARVQLSDELVDRARVRRRLYAY